MLGSFTPRCGTLHFHSRNLSRSLDTCGAKEPCIVVYLLQFSHICASFGLRLEGGSIHTGVVQLPWDKD